MPLSPRNASYAISVRLDAKTHRLAGRERVTWQNLTVDTVSDARFHLYLNAFSNNRSVFMRESGGQLRSIGFDEESWGYCKITSIIQMDPSAPGGKAALAQTFPGEDRTVMRVTLPQPVPPGGETVFEIVFESQLPGVFARSGFDGDFHMVGQWFPKLGVYQEGRGWNCHAYHANSEFFADFGVYDVEITTPKRFVVGATGVEWAKVEKGGEVTRRYHAEDIHDFAWTACPDFVEVKDRWERAGHRVDLRFLMLPGNLPQQPRYARALKAALDWTADHLSPFPYPVFTVVDPASAGAAGMEYPTLVTAGTIPGMPRSTLWPELVVAHEFSHNYFCGMSASNEFEEAWLDEGFTSYCEMRIMESMFGKERSSLDGLFGWSVSNEATQRMTYTGLPDLDPMVKKSWEYKGNGSYSAISYSKSALVLRTLENQLGRPAFDRALKEYFRRTKFTHPTTDDFERIFPEAVGRDLQPMLHGLLYGTSTVDFEVASARTWRVPKDRGYFEKGEKMVLVGAAGEDKNKKGGTAKPPPADFISEVTIHRKGDLILPVEVKLTFENGSTRLEKWNGMERWKKFRYTGSRVVKVEVDPEGKVPLDLCRLNNGWQAKQDALPARSLVNRMRILVQGVLVVLLNVL
jgi:hypothetical protein